MHDDDKTVIIYTGEEDNSTQIAPAFSQEPVFEQQQSMPPVQERFDVPFIQTHQSQPFLNALRALYREVYLMEQRGDTISPEMLQRKLIEMMDNHMRGLADLGYENTHIMMVRYILSTFIDELLGTKAWSGGEAWANHSLLGYYYKETYGGEKFFQLLDQYVREPGKYMQHMKLMYACISLGYKGRYSLTDNADVQIESVRQELFARIKNYDEQNEKFYKDHPVSAKKHKLTLNVPYKLFIIGAVIIMATVYGIFSSMVTQNEEDLIQVLKKDPKMVSNKVSTP
jgi:type VI secretion system protein ImpK